MKKYTAILLLSLLGLPFTSCNTAEPEENLSETKVPDEQVFVPKSEIRSSRPDSSQTVSTDSQVNKTDELKRYFDTPCVDEIQSHLSVMPDNFTIDPSVDNTIEGKKGTVVQIPANSLVFKNGQAPKGAVNINLTECYKLADFLGENLATYSNGKQLETGGMVKVLATSGGRSLEVKSGSAFKVGMPISTSKPNMQLFYGEEKRSQPVNWVLAENNNQSEISKRSEFVNNPQPRGKTLLGSKAYHLYLNYHTISVGADENLTEITYRLKDRTETLDAYINDNFEFTPEIIRSFEKQDGNKMSLFHMKINKSGRITSVNLGKNPNPLELALKSFLLNKTPLLDVNSMYSKDFNFTYSYGFRADIRIDSDKYNDDFKAKYGQNANQTLSDVNEEELNYYVFTATKFGWINCDRFYNNPAPKVDFYVDVPNAKNTKLMLAFESVSSVMQGVQVGNRYVFKNLPEGEKVKVIGVSYRDKEPVLAVEHTAISNQSLNLNSFQAFSLNELTEELNSLN